MKINDVELATLKINNKGVTELDVNDKPISLSVFNRFVGRTSAGSWTLYLTSDDNKEWYMTTEGVGDGNHLSIDDKGNLEPGTTDRIYFSTVVGIEVLPGNKIIGRYTIADEQHGVVLYDKETGKFSGEAWMEFSSFPGIRYGIITGTDEGLSWQIWEDSNPIGQRITMRKGE